MGALARSGERPGSIPNSAASRSATSPRAASTSIAGVVDQGADPGAVEERHGDVGEGLGVGVRAKLAARYAGLDQLHHPVPVLR